MKQIHVKKVIRKSVKGASYMLAGAAGVFAVATASDKEEPVNKKAVAIFIGVGVVSLASAVALEAAETTPCLDVPNLAVVLERDVFDTEESDDSKVINFNPNPVDDVQPESAPQEDK